MLYFDYRWKTILSTCGYEQPFKCRISGTSHEGAAHAAFFLGGRILMQHVHIYIDDSGNFCKSNEFLVYAGYIFFSNQERDIASRKFIAVEDKIRQRKRLDPNIEIKASILRPKQKSELYRSLNGFDRFSCVINCHKIQKHIWSHKKHKQRFIDYALKRTIKDSLRLGSKQGKINLAMDVKVHVHFDQHTTATSGKYEFKEGLLEELVYGTFNINYQTFFKPILTSDSTVSLKYYNSSRSILIRAADIVANTTYYQFNFSGNNLKEITEKLDHHIICRHP